MSLASQATRGGALRRWGSAVGAVMGVAAFALFYYKYVPLVPGFQMFLAPVLVAVLVLSLSGMERGLRALVVALPLINSLPYFFDITETIPHAPTALPLLLAFVLGHAGRTALFSGANGGKEDRGPLPLGRPVAIFSALIVVSAAITSLRYAGFYPIAADAVMELVVNALDVRAGGAIMSAVFSGLSYLLGFLVFAAVWRTPGGRNFEESLLRLLAVSALPALAFAAYQAWRAPALGNTPFWVTMGQVNGTFKDPNSLAGFVAAFIPVALGLALAAREWKKRALPLAGAIFGLAVLPHAGSRSGLAGVAVGLAVFGAASAVVRMMGRGGGKERRRLRLTVAAGGAVVGFILVVLLLGLFGSTLAERMHWSADVFRGDLTVDDFFNLRLTLWTAAVRMTAAYPLSGVGVGAYIIELPNVLAGWSRFGTATDSVLNYFLQVGAELGIPGVILIAWIFVGIAVRMVRALRIRPVDFVALGVASGLSAFIFIFVFHTYIGSFEVIAVFWLLTGLLFRMTDGRKRCGRDAEIRSGDVTGKTEARGRIPGKKPGVAAMAVGLAGVLIFGVVHLRNSLGPLSIEQRTKDFAWVQDFGFYGWESDARGFRFRWSGKRVGLVLPDLGVPLVLPVAAMHPDIASRPVVVRVCRADRRFRPEELLLEYVLRDKDWSEIEIPAGGNGREAMGDARISDVETEGWGDVVRLIIEVDRTWSPMRDLGVPDPRELGFALGEPWYRHPEALTDEGRIARSEVFSEEIWEGPWGKDLFGDASASMRFRFEPKEGEAETGVIELNLRGRSAVGVWPFAVIRLDGRIIGRTFVRSEDWVTVALYPEMAPGEHLLSVEFTNDYNDACTGADRNLFLGPLRLLYLQQNK